MKKKLNITIVQANIFWQNKEANFEHIEQMIQSVNSDLIILPEMFNTGFNIIPYELAEDLTAKLFSG
jgi:predicted amidohydrolase